MELNSRENWCKIKPNDLWEYDCPFCDVRKTPLIQEFKYWYICYNKYPYWGIKDNLLAIPKKHRKYTYDLSPEEFWEFQEVEKFIKDFYKKQDYFSFIRQSTRWRSLEHLHYHYLPGFVSGSDVENILYKNQIHLWKV